MQEKLAKQLQVSQGAVSLRLNSLGMIQKLSRWVPHELSERQQERRLHNKLILQHDNAPAHNATVVKNTIKDLGWELLPHPLYSPDLAPVDGSGQPKNTTEREDKAVDRTAVVTSDSTLSTIHRVTSTQVYKMTINRRLRERNLRARRPLRCLPLTPVHRQRVVTACTRVVTACTKVVTACTRVVTACIRVVTACTRVVTACTRVVTACTKVVTACTRVVTACIRVVTACTVIIAKKKTKAIDKMKEEVLNFTDNG
ncbi:NR6A1 [Cordylochernes scorpioides]|uniref:NR6A1 n=1 Tax=Cordylochernes scorpioides TaxID=51811 RepID=A0ABY6L132_9ARAC|nr:NR6A1 [Cordylochernes scorpioides]